LTANSADEPSPSVAGQLTPLGVRQQYLIGDELRYRYVEEQKNQFLDEKYNISQIYIQSMWADHTVLSAQAMLLGLYPPG